MTGMIEVQGDLLTFEHYDPSTPVWKVLPTNYAVDDLGLAIMGAGLAKQFVKLYGKVAAYELGVMILANPSITRVLPLGVYGNAFWWALPTKLRPEDKSTTDLIRSGLWELNLYRGRQLYKPAVVLPRLGCGCGKLQWRHVKPIIDGELKDADVVLCHK